MKKVIPGDTPQGGLSCPCGAIHLLCLGNHTAQTASVQAKRVRVAVCIPSKKCVHF